MLPIRKGVGSVSASWNPTTLFDSIRGMRVVSLAETGEKTKKPCLLDARPKEAKHLKSRTIGEKKTKKRVASQVVTSLLKMQ